MTATLHPNHDRNPNPNPNSLCVSVFLLCFVFCLFVCLVLRDYQMYLHKLTVKQVSNGDAREEFAGYLDRMAAISKRWAARNVMTLVY